MLYKKWIEPRSNDPDQQSRELVLNWLLAGSIGFIALQLLNLLASLFIRHKTYLGGRILILSILLAGFISLFVYSRRYRRLIFAKFAVVGFFLICTTYVFYYWGILTPVGLLLGSLVIVMASVLLGARHALYAALLLGVILGSIEYGKAHGYIHPDLAWMQQSSTFTDVVSSTIIFLLLALITWLFNGQMENSLRRARRSEQALKRQSEMLEEKVEERTRELQVAQIEKIQQFYRFAELGHLSTALFHDLADPLMSVSLDIEGLKKRHRSEILGRIQENISYVDSVVRQVRHQIQGKPQIERLNLAAEIKKIIKLLNSSAVETGVVVELNVAGPSQSLFYEADTVRFRQVITNLLSNGIESYRNVKHSKDRHKLTVDVTLTEKYIIIKVRDYGEGIPVSEQTKIFEPFYSNKDKGSGIGLFIVKQVVEQDFHGRIELLSSKERGTTFTVTLPKKYDGKKR